MQFPAIPKHHKLHHKDTTVMAVREKNKKRDQLFAKKQLARSDT